MNRSRIVIAIYEFYIYIYIYVCQYVCIRILETSEIKQVGICYTTRSRLQATFELNIIMVFESINKEQRATS